MIIRIVHMQFQEGKIADFLELFNHSKETILSFQGCEYLELIQDIKKPSHISTLSKWQSEIDLNNYRNSDFFQATWKNTKILFAAKPSAYSFASLYSKS
jgi:heme oxygenase (mycobilin-producing)